MRQVVLMMVVSLVLIGCRVSEGPQVTAGRLDSYELFASKYVTPRTIRVWVPEDYSANEQYDVLYMHDGQMLWDAQASP